MMIKKIPDNLWFPFWVDKWIFGSMRIDFNPIERAIWVDLLALGAKDNGFIRANEETAYIPEQLAGLLVYDIDVFKKTLDKFVEMEKLERDENGVLYIKNWDKYKFSDSHKRVIKHRAKKESVTKNVTSETENITHNITQHNKTNHNIVNIYSQNFKIFWKNYPRKIAKKKAFNVWKRLNNDQKSFAMIGAANYFLECKYYQKELEFVKHPATFLNPNNELWLDYQDEFIPPKKKDSERDVGKSTKKISPEQKKKDDIYLRARLFKRKALILQFSGDEKKVNDALAKWHKEEGHKLKE